MISHEASDEVLQAEAIVEQGLLTVGDARAFLGVSRSTLYALMETGRLSYVKIGRSRRTPRKALVRFAALHIRGGWRGGS